MAVKWHLAVSGESHETAGMHFIILQGTEKMRRGI